MTETMPEGIAISLSNGGVAWVDAQDVEVVQRHVWHRDTQGYARAMIKQDGRWRLVRMHRFLIGEGSPQIDHRDHDRLNNRRSNLRACTGAQNMANLRKTTTSTTSRFKGVAWHRASGKWMAQIRIAGRRVYLGLFVSESAAASAYDAASIAANGEFAAVAS